MADENELFPATGRRVKFWRMPTDTIFRHFKNLNGRTAMRLYGFPADAHVAGVRYEEGVVLFLVESVEWPLVEEHGTIEEVVPQILTAVMPPGMEVRKPSEMTDEKPETIHWGGTGKPWPKPETV